MVNSGVKISVLIPTRMRTSLCSKAILSLVENIISTESIEIILACDEDDKDTVKDIDKIVKDLYSNIILKYKLFNRKGYGKLHKYYDEIIKIVDSNSELLLFFGDDFCMHTKDWDKKLLDFHEKNIFGAYFFASKHSTDREGQTERNLTCAIPKSWIEVTGRCSAVNNTDSWMEFVSKEAGCYYSIKDIYVTHNKNIPNDITEKESKNTRIAINQKKIFHSKEMKKQRSIDANKIKNHLKKIK